MKQITHQLEADLDALDSEWVEIDGSQIKPSQCFHIGTDPLHVLFNLNCPESLRQKVNAILAKHQADESGPQQ